jgi:hypothetical protein
MHTASHRQLHLTAGITAWEDVIYAAAGYRVMRVPGTEFRFEAVSIPSGTTDPLADRKAGSRPVRSGVLRRYSVGAAAVMTRCGPFHPIFL